MRPLLLSGQRYILSLWAQRGSEVLGQPAVFAWRFLRPEALPPARHRALDAFGEEDALLLSFATCKALAELPRGPTPSALDLQGLNGQLRLRGEGQQLCVAATLDDMGEQRHFEERLPAADRFLIAAYLRYYSPLGSD